MVASSSKHRPRCFFDITINGALAGRVTFELFTDICPLTCENFRALCTGEKGIGKTTEKPLHYKGTPIHRVVKDFIIQGGDFSAGNGTGGESIYGGTFSDENFDVKHDKPFFLSMANRGKDTNGSQFFITTKPAPHLDGIHTVFGQVLLGSEVVQEVENLRIDNKSRPTTDVRVVNCGELVLKIKAKEPKKKKKPVSSDEDSSSEESSLESSSESEDEKQKKKKKKQKERKEHKRDKIDESVVDEPKPSIYQSELSANVTINPDQIPEIPTNNFLLRRSPSDLPNQQMRRMNPSRTRSGRKVKGRGIMRYHTPSRSRSRSVTPPHWRVEERRLVGNLVSDQWQAKGPRRASLGSQDDRWERGMTGLRSQEDRLERGMTGLKSQDDRWERGMTLQSTKSDNRHVEPPPGRSVKREMLIDDRARLPRDRDNGIERQRGRSLAGRIGDRPLAGRIGDRPLAGRIGDRPLAGRIGDRPLTGRNNDRRAQMRDEREQRGKGNVEVARRTDRGKVKDNDKDNDKDKVKEEKEKEKEKKHKKEKDKSHKKHKKHKKHSDKDKLKDHEEAVTKHKRTSSPRPRSRSPRTKKDRARSPRREKGSGGAGRRRSSPSPRGARGNTVTQRMDIKTNDRARHSKSLSPPPSRWKPGQKPWKPSDVNKEPGARNQREEEPLGDRPVLAAKSPSSSAPSMDERSPSPVQLRRHGPNRSPSPRHLSPHPQHDLSSPSRSPLPINRQKAWPTSPSERVKLAAFPPPPSPPRSRSSSSSNVDDNDDSPLEDGQVSETHKTGDPYSTKNRKKYQKATEQRKRSPTLKERFQWQPPSEDEAEIGGAGTGGADGRRTGQSHKMSAQTDRSRQSQVDTRQEHEDKNSNSSENEGIEDLEQKRTDLELRLAALTSQNRKIQEMMSGGIEESNEEDNKAPSVDKAEVAHSPELPVPAKLKEVEIDDVASPPRKAPETRAPRESSPKPTRSEGKPTSKAQHKRGHSRSRSRSRSPAKKRRQSRSRSHSRSPGRDCHSLPKSKERKRSEQLPRSLARSRSRSRSRSPRRRSRSPVRAAKRSPPRSARKRSRSYSSSSRSPTPSKRSRSPRRLPAKRSFRKSPVRKSRRSRSSSSSRGPSPGPRGRKRPAISPRRSKSRSRSRGRIARGRRRSPSRERRRPSPRRPSPRRPSPRRLSPRRRRRTRSPSPRRRSRSTSRNRRRSRSPVPRRRSRSKSRSRGRRLRSPPRRDKNRQSRRSYSRSSSRSHSSRSRSRSRSKRRSYSRSSRSYSRSSG